MNEKRMIRVATSSGPGFARRPFEACEHKGVGHPDTLTDGACEAAAVALARAYVARYGRVLHFNVDKGLLVAGRSEPRFGGGAIHEPMKLIVCGRATNPDGTVDVDAIVTAAVREHLQHGIGNAAELFRIELAIAAGSANLQEVYRDPDNVPRANDTSIGVGYAPLSQLERDVLAVAGALRSAGLRQEFPAAGWDFKVMGIRSGSERSLTIAIAMIDRHLTSVRDYFDVKAALERHLAVRFPGLTSLVVNALDDPEARSEAGVYLTVSGLSAEMGDDGQVGRGNRVNGLITPGRAMSLEAAAGKNPSAHVGKIYNVLANAIAHTIVDGVPEIAEASVLLVSQIGRPVDDPWIVAVDVVPRQRFTPAVTACIEALVERELGAISELTARLVAGTVPVY